LARDRKRAKQRQQQRRTATPTGRRAGGTGAGNGSGAGHSDSGNGSAQPLTRADLPGALEHAGEVDEFDAAIVRGAGGLTAASPSAAEEAEREQEAERAGAGEESLAQEIERFTAPVDLAAPGERGDLATPGEPDDLATPRERDDLAAPGERGGLAAPGESAEPRRRRFGRNGAAGNGAAAAAESVPARVTTRAPAEREHRQSLPARAVAFLRASWAELQRVQWPNRAQVTQATAVVIGFVAIAGLYFGLADYVAKEIVEAIL
jgi:preprotein translocase SecE subunit